MSGEKNKSQPIRNIEDLENSCIKPMLGIITAVIIVIIGFTIVLITERMARELEIASHLYKNVNALVVEYPELQPKLQRYLEDGRISPQEYDKLWALKHDLDYQKTKRLAANSDKDTNDN